MSATLIYIMGEQKGFGRFSLGMLHPYQTPDWFNNMTLKTKTDYHNVNHPKGVCMFVRAYLRASTDDQNANRARDQLTDQHCTTSGC
jgi:hypothetical protein